MRTLSVGDWLVLVVGTYGYSCTARRRLRGMLHRFASARPAKRNKGGSEARQAGMVVGRRSVVSKAGDWKASRTGDMVANGVCGGVV